MTMTTTAVTAVMTMTNPNKPKRGAPTYNGLKSLLIITGMTASILGSWLIAAEQQGSAAQAIPAEASGFDPSALQPIPTAMPPRLEPPTPQPADVAAGGAGSPPVQSGSAPAVPAGSQPEFALPPVISVHPLPALPPINAGGGGGGAGQSS